MHQIHKRIPSQKKIPQYFTEHGVDSSCLSWLSREEEVQIVEERRTYGAEDIQGEKTA